MDNKETMLAELERLWPQSSGFFRVPEDVENGQGEEIGGVIVEDHDEDDMLTLSLVKTRRALEGLGFGSRMLDTICRIADQHGVALYIEIVPTGRLSEEDLSGWYEKRGFESLESQVYAQEGHAMERSPRPVPDLAPA